MNTKRQELIDTAEAVLAEAKPEIQERVSCALDLLAIIFAEDTSPHMEGNYYYGELSASETSSGKPYPFAVDIVELDKAITEKEGRKDSR